jgi:hypothetical protein
MHIRMGPPIAGETIAPSIRAVAGAEASTDRLDRPDKVRSGQSTTSFRDATNTGVTTPPKVWQAREYVCVLKRLSTERPPIAINRTPRHPF